MFDGVKHGVMWMGMHGNDMQMRLCIIKLGVASSYMVIRGGDARLHTFLG